MKHWIHRLGRRPSQSLWCFKVGIGLFALSLSLIFAGAYHWLGWQVLGLCISPVAIGFSAWGYVGILANRISRFFYQVEESKKSLNDPPE